MLFYVDGYILYGLLQMDQLFGWACLPSYSHRISIFSPCARCFNLGRGIKINIFPLLMLVRYETEFFWVFFK